MDLGTWIGIVGLVLAIPLGIATNLLTTRVVAYLEKRKILKSHRSKAQDLAAYKRIEAFKNGTRDKYPYYILLAAGSVTCGMVSATCVILAALKIGSDFFESNPPGLPNPLLLIAFFFCLFALVFMGIIAETARRIEQFEKYQAEVRKKWGKNTI